VTVLIGHQPLFVGSLEWWARIATADVFVLSDDVDFEPKSAQARHLIDGVLRSLPVVHEGRPVPIAETRVAITDPAIGKLERAIPMMWPRAPHRESARRILWDALEAAEVQPALVNVTVSMIREVHSYLGLSSRLVKASQLRLRPMPDGLPNGPTARIVRQCAALGADQYWCGPSGAEYLALELFEAEGIGVAELEWCPGSEADDGTLSLLDVIAAAGHAGTKERIGRCRPSRWLVPAGTSAATSSRP